MKVWQKGLQGARYLFQSIGVNENPANLDHLGGIFGHVNSMLVAGGSNVNDDVAVRVALAQRLRRHVVVGGRGEAVARKAQLQLQLYG